MVLLRVVGARLRIQAKPDSVSGAALAQLMFILAEEQPRSVALVSLDRTTWSHNVLGSWVQAIARLEKRFGGNLSTIAKPTSIVISSEPLDALERGAALSWAMELRTQHGHSFAPEMIAAVDSRITSRFALYERPARASGLVLVSASRGYPADVQRVLDRLVGFDVRDRPDAEYARACHDAFSKVLATDHPLLQVVEGTMRWRKLMRTSHRYRRLLVPLTDRSGKSWLLSATIGESDPIIVA